VFIVLGYKSFQWTASFGTKYIRAAREHQDELTKQMRLLIDGIKELKMHKNRMDSFLNDAVVATNRLVRENQTIGFTIQGTAISWGRLMFFIAIGSLLFSSQAMLGLDQARLTGCAIVALFLMTPVERIIAWLPLLARAKVAIAKIEMFGDLDRESEAGLPSATFQSFHSIVFEGVAFQYEQSSEERTFSFGPADFTLNCGEVVFLVGGNGSGKTTFLKLLTGLYEPDVGRIVLDDLEISCHNREDYRQLFAVVFAEPILFDSLHGLTWHDDEHLQRLLKHLELDKKVQIVDGKLSSTDLSKGQRKRLALLTAYLEERPIYVFDEWAADQDPIYKRVFYEEILPSLQHSQRTVVVISHDDHYYTKGDRIVRLVDGQISSVEANLAAQTNNK
jgi:putative ATP-binding cassette transporter